jgi:hypothetical protein
MLEALKPTITRASFGFESDECMRDVLVALASKTAELLFVIWFIAKRPIILKRAV